MNFVAQISQQAVNSVDNEKKLDLESQKFDHQKAMDEQSMRVKMEELRIRSREVAQRAREDATKRYVATVNKN